MIYAPARRYVFVHIPKTGGTSMAHALEARAQAEDLLIGDTPKARKRADRLRRLDPGKRLWKHSSYRNLAEVVGQDTLSGCLVFTLVRNPWLRVLSYYHWLCDQSWDHPAVTIAKAKDFNGFVQDPFIGQSLQALPYEHYVAGAAKPLFVRLEALEEDLAPISEYLGFALTLPHENASARPQDWRAAYTAESRARVAQLCAQDIARF